MMVVFPAIAMIALVVAFGFIAYQASTYWDK